MSVQAPRITSEDRILDAYLQHMEVLRTLPKLTKHVRYESRIVVFMDILGWSRLITQSTSDAATMRRLAGLQLWWAADQHLHLATRHQKPGLRSDGADRTTSSGDELLSVIQGQQRTHFSDSLVLSWPRPRTVETLNHVLFDLADTIRNLFLSRFLVRGAVVSGRVFHRPDVIFGPAIVDAYRLESTLAVYPRVLVSETVASRARSPLLRRDHDGLPFIDFLRLGRGVPWYARFMNQVRSVLLEEHQGLRRDVAAQSKWSWVISYFNALAAETGDSSVRPIGRRQRTRGAGEQPHNNPFHLMPGRVSSGRSASRR